MNPKGRVPLLQEFNCLRAQNRSDSRRSWERQSSSESNTQTQQLIQVVNKNASEKLRMHEQFINYQECQVPYLNQSNIEIQFITKMLNKNPLINQQITPCPNNHHKNESEKKPTTLTTTTKKL